MVDEFGHMSDGRFVEDVLAENQQLKEKVRKMEIPHFIQEVREQNRWITMYKELEQENKRLQGTLRGIGVFARERDFQTYMDFIATVAEEAIEESGE